MLPGQIGGGTPVLGHVRQLPCTHSPTYTYTHTHTHSRPYTHPHASMHTNSHKHARAESAWLVWHANTSGGFRQQVPVMKASTVIGSSPLTAHSSTQLREFANTHTHALARAGRSSARWQFLTFCSLLGLLLDVTNAQLALQACSSKCRHEPGA